MLILFCHFRFCHFAFVLKAWAHGMNDIDPSASFYPALQSNAFSVRCIKD